jgi:hypothetical protein
MKNGLKPIRKDHRDFDFHKSFGSLPPPSFPISYDCDAALTMPNQNAQALPYGCTGETQTDICTNEDLTVYDAAELYRATPPYIDGEGRDIRDSLNIIISRGPKDLNGTLGPKRLAYFNIRALAPLDWFDGLRLAMLSTASEKRAISLGIPWFPEFENPTSDGTLPTPPDFDTDRASWHNATIAGWDERGLKIKSWQGAQYGQNGWVYMPRAVINALMEISGTAAFTVSKVQPSQILTVDLGFVQFVVSWMRSLIGLQ